MMASTTTAMGKWTKVAMSFLPSVFVALGSSMKEQLVQVTMTAEAHVLKKQARPRERVPNAQMMTSALPTREIPPIVVTVVQYLDLANSLHITLAN
mmetsp:Transcript_21721/g.43943  ORF Transcript_21721/g.43943 Transcript_21721/m.43943 type:complete len:96 (-) Transcript_21721:1318-1605(-)